MASSASSGSRCLHRFAVFTAVCTLLLIGIGGLVTSHGVGMAVPDWPTTYGYNMFYFPVSSWVGGIFYEHSHRLWASWVGLLTTVLAIWLHGHRAKSTVFSGSLLLTTAGGMLAINSRSISGLGFQLLVAGMIGLIATRSKQWPEPASPLLRRLGFIAFVAVLFQGLLGGLRVVWLKDAIGIAHATLAQVFFAITCAIALFTSRWCRESQSNVRAVKEFRGIRRLVTLYALLVLIQLILGAAMRHQHSGLAVPDFPLAYGQWWPPMEPQFIERINQTRLDLREFHPITPFQIWLHMGHRIGALAVLTASIFTVFHCSRLFGVRSRPGLWAQGALVLVICQACLGAFTVWSNKAADIATLHVVCGALLFVAVTLAAAIASQRRFFGGQPC